MRYRESRSPRAFPWLIGALFGLCLALLVVSIMLLVKIRQGSQFLPASPGAVLNGGTGIFDRDAIVAARRRVSPSVVSVTAYRTQMVYAWDAEFFQRYQIRRPRRQLQKFPSYGSGIIVNPDGYILTNAHVIQNAEEIYVTLTDSIEVQAALIGSVTRFDLALLKIEGKNLPYSPLGDSDNLEIGEPVIAIGSPFTYLFNDNQPTVTAG
ncbi:MAG: trypsin-like peptidase domain-containing protein, partial [Candidatus Krumholzibacteriota bacterium]|nr:trypsin-like peptidase domain-containing protein [Candidatus Krumholzibacteriota bacterium]